MKKIILFLTFLLITYYISKAGDYIDFLISTGNGQTYTTAYKVSSVNEEYEVLKRLHCESISQTLIFKNGKYYDVLNVKDKHSGVIRNIYFDINNFFPKKKPTNPPRAI